jgi:transcriptional regulator with XRE-family HTH domain
MSNFGERLRKLRLGKKMSQMSLAARIGLSQEAISKYERGIVSPSIDVIRSLRNFFNVSSDYLIGATDEEEWKCSNELDTAENELISIYRGYTYQNKNLLLIIAKEIKNCHDSNGSK